MLIRALVRRHIEFSTPQRVRMYREFWAEIHLEAGVEITAKTYHLAIDLFAETILVEAKGCQGSNQLLLRRVVIDFPLRRVMQSCTC